MHEFDLEVEFKGKQHLFNVRMETYAYSYKFFTEVELVPIIIEVDEERDYRVLQADPSMQPPDTDLVGILLNRIIALH